MGLQIAGSGEACDAALTIEVTIIAIEGKYSGKKCYAAYVGGVQTILSSQEDASEVVISRDFERKLPAVVTESECYQEVSEALYDRFEKVGNYHLSRALLETLVELWGPRVLNTSIRGLLSPSCRRYVGRGRVGVYP